MKFSDTASAETKVVFAAKAKQLQEMNATFAAQDSVDRETNRSIVTPAYTRSALLQMGMQRSRGEHPRYREVFASAFADTWSDRYTALTGLAVL